MMTTRFHNDAEDRRIERLANREAALGLSLKTSAADKRSVEVVEAAAEIEAFLERHPANGAQAVAFGLELLGRKPACKAVLDAAQIFVVYLNVDSRSRPATANAA